MLTAAGQRPLNTALDLILTRPPPSPDLENRSSYRSEYVAEILHVGIASYRAVLTQDGDGLYRVRIEHWDTGDWEAAGLAQWLPVGRTSTIVDTLERARMVAADRLREFTPRIDEP